jgi:hypothetical protein
MKKMNLLILRKEYEIKLASKKEKEEKEKNNEPKKIIWK